MTARPKKNSVIEVRRTAPGLNTAGWRLATRAPIPAYDEYYDEELELHIGQRDPNRIEGLVIDFRYVTRDREFSRRSVLCWQCGRDGDRLYVRGYCAFREELRTFRIDRMSDLIAIRDEHELPVEDISAFFAAFAAREAPKRSTLRLGAHD